MTDSTLNAEDIALWLNRQSTIIAGSSNGENTINKRLCWRPWLKTFTVEVSNRFDKTEEFDELKDAIDFYNNQ